MSVSEATKTDRGVATGSVCRVETIGLTLPLMRLWVYGSIATSPVGALVCVKPLSSVQTALICMNYDSHGGAHSVQCAPQILFASFASGS